MCRWSARSSGQVGRIAYSCRLWKAGSDRGGAKAQRIAWENTKRSGQYCNERSIIIKINEKSSYSSSSRL
jgi:hypothetical protein